MLIPIRFPMLITLLRLVRILSMALLVMLIASVAAAASVPAFTTRRRGDGVPVGETARNIVLKALVVVFGASTVNHSAAGMVVVSLVRSVCSSTASFGSFRTSARRLLALGRVTGPIAARLPAGTFTPRSVLLLLLLFVRGRFFARFLPTATTTTTPGCSRLRVLQYIAEIVKQRHLLGRFALQLRLLVPLAVSSPLAAQLTTALRLSTNTTTGRSVSRLRLLPVLYPLQIAERPVHVVARQLERVRRLLLGEALVHDFLHVCVDHLLRAAAERFLRAELGRLRDRVVAQRVEGRVFRRLFLLLRLQALEVLVGLRHRLLDFLPERNPRRRAGRAELQPAALGVLGHRAAQLPLFHQRRYVAAQHLYVLFAQHHHALQDADGAVLQQYLRARRCVEAQARYVLVLQGNVLRLAVGDGELQQPGGHLRLLVHLRRAEIAQLHQLHHAGPIEAFRLGAAGRQACQRSTAILSQIDVQG
uniref:Uncharacterized protein n=1 Tax=Anopheles quadriannulatus TaxID=34691 RepID=A0A182XR75_ANOQN